jgi:Flp pilus assembly protein TadG
MSRHIRGRSCVGQALVETALVIVLMVVLLFTIFDFSHFYWSLLTVQNGVTQGTRFAITNRQFGGMTRDESIRRAIKDATPGIAIDDADITFFNVTDNTAGSGSFNDTIRVTVRHEFNFFTPVMQMVFDGGRITFQASSTMKNEPSA